MDIFFLPRRYFWQILTMLLIATFILISNVFVVLKGFSPTAMFPVDCAIVFGSVVHGEGSAGPGIRRRVGTATFLHENDFIRSFIVVSGGRGRPGQKTEAEVMNEYALRNGVSVDNVRLEEKARSTWENLLFSKKLLSDCSSVVAISDRYHLARIRYLAEKQGGWDHLHTYPALWVPDRWFEWRSILREAFALVYYRLTLSTGDVHA